MSATEWLNRGVSLFAVEKSPANNPSALVDAAQTAPKKIVTAASPEVLPSGRSTRERLKAMLRKKEEALSPRILRRTLEELKAIVDPAGERG